MAGSICIEGVSTKVILWSEVLEAEAEAGDHLLFIAMASRENERSEGSASYDHVVLLIP